MDKPVMIIGATALGKAVLEIFQHNSVVVYGFLDDDPKLHGTEIDNIPVLGSVEESQYFEVVGKNCDVFIASDDDAYRANLIKLVRTERKTMPVNAIHKTAEIARNAEIHHGNFINQKAVIGALAKIGNHCIIHTGAIVDFTAELGDFVQVGAGSIINAGAKISDGVFIGSGVTIVSGVKIGKGASIGAGSVVIANVAAGETVFGNPAKRVV